MKDFGEKLKQSYVFLNDEKFDEAKKGFEEICKSLKNEKLDEGENNYNHYLSALIGLGVVNMQKGDMKKALEFYLEGNKLSKGKDFNVLFNLGVVYMNLQDDENSNKYLEKAKTINPNDPNLIRFLGEQNESGNEKKEEETPKKVDKNFEDKIARMVDKLKK